MADEPTGSLKSSTADAVFQLFQDLAQSGKTIVLVTHERDVARQVNRIVEPADGQIVYGGMLLPNATLCTREVADA